MKKIYSTILTLFIVSLFAGKILAQGTDCATSEPFCTSVGTPFSYNNVTGFPDPTDVGCLLSVPNQSWFYIKTSSAGAMTYSLTQSSVAPGGTPNLDVDFIAYGPFTSAQFSVACATLLTGTCTADHACTGNIEDCSYSIAATETMTLNSTAAGEYFIIMITNYEDLPGYITFTQTGGSPSDCSIACPPNNFTMVGSLNSTGANLPNGSTVNCSEPFWIDPPDLTPPGQPYNPFTDQLTPCLKVQINPLTANVKTGGTIQVYENGTNYWTACPTCVAPQGPVGGSAAAGTQFGWYLGQVDPAYTHPAVFCRTAPLGATTPTVQLMSCWNNSLVLAGPQTWGSTACFTLTAPTGTANYGSATFSIAPATGSVGIVDLNWGTAYVDPSFLPAGTTYTVTYTFNNGICGNLNGFYVFTVPSTPTITISGSAGNQTVCSGSAVSATNFTVTPSAGATFNWTNSNTAIGVAATGTANIAGYTAPTVTASTVGIFTVTSTANGCTGNPRTFSITINPRPVANAGTSGTITCSNPTLSLSGSGGGTYAWTGPSITSGSNTATPAISAPGSYSLVVTSAAGCTSTVSTVSVPSNTTAPTAGASNTATLTCATTTAALTGTGGGTYSWSGTGIVSGGATANPVVNGTGPYTVTVTAANGCTATANTSVAQNTTAPTPGASNSTTLTCTTTTAALTGTGGGTYLWTGPGTITNNTTANPTVNTAGTFTVRVTAANGCTATANTTVSQNTTAPTAGASNTATLTCATTTAALTGTGGGTYSWSGTGIVSGGATANPVVNGTGPYTVTVTAANGCTATANTSVAQNTTAPTPGASNSTTLTCTTTTAALTGTGGGTYLWTGPGTITNNTTANPTVNTAGTFTVRVTAANGCTATANTTVSQNTTAPTAGASNTATLTCATTTAALTGTGGGTYSWSGTGIVSGGATANPVVNGTGPYTVTVTAANGCTATANTSVAQNTTAPTPGASNSTTLTCTTTTAALTGTGGGTYLWTGPGTITNNTTANPTVNTAGTFTVRVTAANGCTATANTTVSQNTTAPTAGASNTATLTCATTTAALTGTGGGTYNWSGTGIVSGGATANPVVNGTGPYTVTVTAANGCTATANTSVAQNTTAPTPGASNSSTLSCTTNTVSLTGTGGGTYLWTGPGTITNGTTANPSVNTAGTFTVLVTAANGCTATAITTVSQNTVSPTVTMPSTQTITCASPTVSMIGSANPSTCTPVWTGGACAGATSFTASACSPNTYTLTVTNPANGCTNSGTVSVVPSVGTPVVNTSNTGSITCTNTSVQVSATTTMTPVSYAWTGPGAVSGASSSTGTVSIGGTYQCVVTNTLTGCASTVTTLVPTNTTAVSASIAPTSSITCSTTSLTLNASPTGSYSYSWTAASGLSGTSVSTPTVTQGGVYSVTITNTINGCVGNTNITVPSNTTIPVVNIAAPSVTTTCSNPTVTIVATSTPSTGVTYSWTAPGSGSLSNSTISNPVASGSGIFTVVVTNTTSGCASSLTQNTVSVTSSTAIPTATLSTNALSITCSNPTVTASTSTTASPVSYSWSPTTGIVAGTETTANPVFNAAGTYSVVVTNTTSGCSSNAASNVVTVTLNNTIPTIALTSGTNNGTITCTNTFVTISPTVTPSANLTYTWSPSGVTSSTLSSATFTAAGIYTLAVTNTVTGCVTSSTASANSFTVIANNTPPTFVLGTAPSVTATCAVPSVTLSGSSNADPNSVYTWTTPSSSTINGNPISVSSPGIYTVAVTNTINGCSSAAVSQNTVEVVADAGIPNITLSANSVSITCSNPTPSVAITTTASPVSYSWTPTSGIVAGTETTANPVFNAAGSYSVVVTNTITGCATGVASNIVNVSLDNTIPTIALSSSVNNGTITCTNTIVTISPTVTPSANLTYTWLPSGVTSSTINDAIFTSAGVYTLAVTNTVTGCVSSLTNTANTFTVIADNATPTFTLGTANSVTTTCAAPNATLSASSDADPNAVYTWTTPSTSTVVSNPLVSSATGIYSVIVTNTVNGCSTSATSPATVEVVADAGIPNVTLSANSVSITCSNPTPSVSITTTASPVSYNWTPTTGIVPGTETTANPVFNAAGSFSVVVTNTASGCATSIANNVVDVTLDNLPPSITLSSGTNSQTITCTNTFVTIAPIVTPTANLTYTWSPSGVVSSSINDATFTVAGIYTLAVTNTLTGCITSSTNTANTYTIIDISAPVTASISITSTNTTIGCGAGSAAVTLQGNSSATSPSYTWMPGSVSSQTFAATASGDYTLSVEDSNNGCSTTTVISVVGSTLTPQGVNAGTSANIACGSSTVTLNGVTTTTNTSFSWSGPTATSIVAGTETSANPIVTEAGDYTLTVTDNATGCSSSDVVIVTQAIATASITANPTSGISPLDVAFTGSGAGNPNYTWDFANGNTSNSQNPNNTFLTGTYIVTLTTTSGSCVATATVEIVVEDGFSLEIPNVFTPNNDGANDVFTIKSTGVKEISLQIFNRWGEKLYEFSGAKASWDGLAPNGIKVPEGTYFYFVKATGFDGSDTEKHGTVNLFR